MAAEDQKSTPPMHDLVGGLSHFVWRSAGAWGAARSESPLDALAHFAKTKPDAPFLWFAGEITSFAQMQERATRMANALSGLGVAKGNTVCVLMDNSADMLTSFFAVTMLGAIWVPTNTAYKGEYLRHQIADAGAALLICDSDYLGNALSVAPEIPALKTIVARDGADSIQTAARIVPFEFIRGGDPTPIDVSVSPHDIACLIYTSGTTGVSKGCMLSHNCIASIGRRRNVSVPPMPGDVTWSCLPLFHIASLTALVIASLVAGERVALGARFSVSNFWDEIEACDATSIILLATMFPLIAKAPETPAMKRCYGKLRVATGVPLSAEDRQIWQERFGVGYMNSFAYGQTEANLVTLLPWGAKLPPLDAMGPPSEDFDMMVAGADRRPVAINEVGELALRPRHPDIMFAGYWGRPLDTLEALCDLWWHTGDLVRMDADGILYFVDRKKDYLRSRGENISSFEAECAVGKHADVAEAAYHAISSKDGLENEEIKLTIVLRRDSTLNERALFDWMQDNLPYFIVPRFIEFRAALPKTPTGKVQKGVLRDEGCTPQTWDAHAHGLTIRRAKKAG